MKVVRIVYLVFVMICLFFSFVLWCFFITDRGMYFMLNNITSRISGLKISSISGNWWHGVVIRGLYYQGDGILVQSSELHVALNFKDLWSKYFSVRSLYVKDFFVCIKTDEFNSSLLLTKDEKRFVLSMINMSPIVFHKIILNNVCIQLDAMVVSLNKCNTGLIYDKKSFTIFSTFFSGLKILNFFDFLKIKLPVLQVMSVRNIFFNKSFLSSRLEDLFSKFFFEKKNIEKIMFCNVILERIEGENLVFLNQENFLIKKICMQGIISKEYIRLLLLDMTFTSGEVRVLGNVKLNRQYPVNLMVNFRAKPSWLGGEKINFVVSGSLNHTLCVYSDFFGDVNGCLILKLELNKFNIPLDLILNIENLDSLFINGSDCLIRKFYFNLHGNYDHYELSLRSSIFLTKLLLSVDIAMNAMGNINNLVISNLNIKNSNNILDVTGIIDNKNDFTNWNIKLIVKKIHMIPSSLIWPINLSGEINSEILFEHDAFRLRLFDVALRGVIRNCHSVYFRSILYRNSFNFWDISQIFLSIGSNTLKISNANFKNTSGITAVIKFPFLNNVFSYFNGSVFGNVNVFFENSGYYRYLLNITAKSFYWLGRDLKIDNIFLKGHLQYSKILTGYFKWELDNVKYHSLFLSKLIFQVTGDAANHDIKLSVFTNLFDIVMRVYGSCNFINKDWHGNIIKIDLVKQKINYRWDTKLITFYRNLPNKCVILANDLDKYIFRVRCYGISEYWSIEKFWKYFQTVHFTIQQSFFLHSSLVNGILMLAADLVWDQKNFFPYGTILLSGKEVECMHMLLGKKLFVIFEDLVLNIYLKKEYLSCNWLSKFSDFGQCNGNLEVSLVDQYGCSGQVFAKNISLFVLNMFLDTNNIVEGILDLDLKFSGNLFYPEIYGDIKLRNFILRGNRIPFFMTSSECLLHFSKCRSVLKGVISTSHGILYVNGNAHWTNIRSIYSRIFITGHNVRVKLSQKVDVDISPIITLEIAPSLFILRGTLDIPWGRVVLKEYSQNNINISSDAVVVNDHTCDQFINYKDFRNTFDITVNIIVRIGDNVKINTFGLDAIICGNLEVIYNKNGFKLQGYINISKGNINIYGQNLLIKKGQLLFSGLINAQPYLNIEAVRSSELIENISSIASVRITGFISSPEVEIFSDCAISREEAISYLLSGQRLDVLETNSNNTIRFILVKLGLFQIEKFVKQFGGVLGIKDLALSTWGFGKHSQIVLSGYVAPRLQVKYGIGMFNSLAVATIRYSLLSNLYLEAVFGGIPAIDLVYQFEY